MAFGAGALAPSAASRVSQMNLTGVLSSTCGGPGQPACATTKASADEESTAYNTDVAIQTAQETSGTGGDTVRK